MENNKSNSLIKVENRKNCILEGVTKLDSFDDKEFLLETIDGYLHIKGKNLSLGNMNMEEGKLIIQGTVDSLIYLNKVANKENAKYTSIIQDYLSLKKPSKKLLSSLIDKIVIDEEQNVNICYKIKQLY